MNMVLKTYAPYAGLYSPSLVPQIESKWEFTHHLGVTAKLISYLLTHSDLCCYKVEFILTIFFFFKTLPSAE